MIGQVHQISRRAALMGIVVALSGCVSGSRNFELPQMATPINEHMFVPIGGIAQWITIEGRDRTNPVVLFLHAGPGSPMTPYADAMFAGWDKDLTLVQWDQRGAGRTYGKNPPNGPVSIDRMVQDGIEVSEFLISYLGVRKIILVGVSWGSILGLHMVSRRPDLFHAYIGQSQVVTLNADLNHDAPRYAESLAAARAADDQRDVSILTGVAPPWRFGLQWRGYHGVAGKYETARITAASAPTAVSSEYASPDELAIVNKGMNWSLDNFFGTRELGPLFDVDFRSLNSNFDVPIFIIMGEKDSIASPVTARAFFDKISAPRKRFYVVPGAGHGPSAPQLALVRRVLQSEVGAVDSN